MDNKYSITLCCNASTSISIDNMGNIWNFGLDISNDEYKILRSPKQINSLFKIETIACGEKHYIFCDIRGSVYSLGNNYHGQLGIGKSNDKVLNISSPIQIEIPSIHQISCGINFTICLSYNGDLWSFGEGIYGQLGIGDKYGAIEPQLIPNLSNVEFVECTGYSVTCKTMSNDYYTWGEGINGQLGNGNENVVRIPTKCLNWPNDIISIKSGYYHSLFLTKEGQVYTCGSNQYGQLGQPSYESKASFSILKNKTLYPVNESSISLLNKPTIINILPTIIKIECGSFHSICLDKNNKIWCFGYNKHGQVGIGENIVYIPIKHNQNNITHISHGGNGTLIKNKNNEIFAFGCNSKFQLGSRDQMKIPKRTLINKEEIWGTELNIELNTSRAKSARK